MTKAKIIKDTDELSGWDFKFGFFKDDGVYEVYLERGSDNKREYVTAKVYEELRDND
jgi:hypothetical protein